MPGVRVRFIPAGHLLGAAMVELSAEGKVLLFSGDLGRPHDLIMRAPADIERADWLIVESTYGDRLHEAADPGDQLADVVNRTAARGGVVVVPSFAVGRAQALMWLVHLLRSAGRHAAVAAGVPEQPDGDRRHAAVPALAGEHRLDRRAVRGDGARRDDRQQRRGVEATQPPAHGRAMIIAASGMATGGRVLHHLRAFAPDARNTILLSGYQAGGTRGRALLDGADAIKIFGEYVPVRAEVVAMDALSAHADYAETLDLAAPASPPRRRGRSSRTASRLPPTRCACASRRRSLGLRRARVSRDRAARLSETVAPEQGAGIDTRQVRAAPAEGQSSA